MSVSVGFIGLGNMGNPMAGNVLKSGFPLTVYDKNPGTMENLVRSGARGAASARQVAESVEVVLTSLPGSPEVEALYLEPGGLIEAAKPGSVLVDLSSVLPSTPRKLEPRAKARGVHFLEAPVSGGVKRYLHEKIDYIENCTATEKHVLIVPGKKTTVRARGRTRRRASCPKTPGSPSARRRRHPSAR